MNTINTVRILAVAVTLFQSEIASGKRAYVVNPGDTLWGISKSYGCDVGTLQKQNAIEGARLLVGQEIEIPACREVDEADEHEVIGPVQASGTQVAAASVLAPADEAEGPGGLRNYEIAPGDTLRTIAARFDTRVEDLVQRNQLTGTRIFPGQSIRVPGPAEGPDPVLGQSIGRPFAGRLAYPVRLSQGPGYVIRRPHRSYGASHTIGHLRTALASLRQRFPRLHRLAVGDISEERGGKITMHASHQSGRDVDLGFYFKTRPKDYPAAFAVATSQNLDFEATWALLTSFTNLASSPTGVEQIFMTYSTQRIIYRLARKHGISKDTLATMFQYPHGKSSTRGIIHHEPGHDEHIHVRFRCPPGDRTCF